jgi:signal transduction histidine kinase
MYGYERGELIGQPILLLSTEPELSRAAMDAEIRFVPLRIHRTKDGRTFPVEITDNATILNGRSVVVAAIRDISDRRRAESALRKANRQLQLFGSITRHDIRNQLLVLSSFIDLAFGSLAEPVKTGNYLDRARTATEEIARHINFTREYQELGSSESSWLDLSSLMPRAQVPDHVVFSSIIVGIEVFGDPLLEKVFFNLLDNSLRHGERVTEIRVSAIQDRGNLVISWEDNGIGIPDREKEQVFERGVGKNTGLGLFLAREILALTDMTIRETGVPGTGARFEITIPAGNWRTIARG